MENKEEHIPQIENRDKYILRRMTQDTVKKIERNALEQQVGGKHYRECEIQPVEYIVKNNLDFLEGNIVKYVTPNKKQTTLMLNVFCIVTLLSFLFSSSCENWSDISLRPQYFSR